MQEIENLLDIIIKNNYKKEMSLLQLLNEIYKIIKIIKTSKTSEMLSEDYITYFTLYNKSSKIITLDSIYNCLSKNKIYKRNFKKRSLQRSKRSFSGNLQKVATGRFGYTGHSSRFNF